MEIKTKKHEEQQRELEEEDENSVCENLIKFSNYVWLVKLSTYLSNIVLIEKDAVTFFSEFPSSLTIPSSKSSL